MPWKVLIADDEPKIRRGLSHFLSQHSDEFVLVAEAEDGEQTLELARQLRPDLFLIDIRMPFLSGLDLIAQLQKEGNDHRIIVVSGHDEFEYARQALSLGVFEYLLKPVEEKVLWETLGKAGADLEAQRQNRQHQVWAREILEKNKAAFRDLFFTAWLTGELSLGEWKEAVEVQGLRFGTSGSLALVKMHETGHSGGSEKTFFFSLALLRLAEKVFAALPNLFLHWDEREGLVIFSEEVSEETWTGVLDEFEIRVRNLFGLLTTVVRLPVSPFPQGLANTYEELCSSVQERDHYENLVSTALSVLDRRSKETDLSLEAVAEEMQISPGHLSRTIKLRTGFSFVETLARIRIRKATILLNDPSVKLYEVAEKVGYNSQHYFSRAFRKILGVSPSDYRKGGQR